MTPEHIKTTQVLDRLIKSYPRADLTLQQVFALDAAKEEVAQQRKILNSRVPTGDGLSGS